MKEEPTHRSKQLDLARNFAKAAAYGHAGEMEYLLRRALHVLEELRKDEEFERITGRSA